MKSVAASVILTLAAALPSHALTLEAGKTYEGSYEITAADFPSNAFPVLSVDSPFTVNGIAYEIPFLNPLDLGNTLTFSSLDIARNVLGTFDLVATGCCDLGGVGAIGGFASPGKGFIRLSVDAGTVDIDRLFVQGFANVTVELPSGDPYATDLSTVTEISDLAEVQPLAPIPLPAAGWLLVAGIGGLGALRGRGVRGSAR